MHESAIGGCAHLSGRGSGSGLPLGQEVKRDACASGDHEADSFAIRLGVVGGDVGLYCGPGLGSVGHQNGSTFGHTRVLGAFGFELPWHGALDLDVPEVGAFVAIDPDSVFEPEVVAFEPGEDLGQVGHAALLSHGLVDRVVEHDLVVGLVVFAWPPLPLGILGELVVAELELEVVGVGIDLVDGDGREFTDVGHFVDGVS